MQLEKSVSSITVTAPRLVGSSIKRAFKTTSLLVSVYALGITIIFSSFGTVPYLVFGLSLLLGGIPALVIAFLAGALIGAILQQSHYRLSVYSAFTIGVWAGVVVLAIPTALLTWWVYTEIATPFEFTIYAYIWYIPCVIALAGLGWVGYKVNEELPVRGEG